jgi:type IV secretion system protein VirB2
MRILRNVHSAIGPRAYAALIFFALLSADVVCAQDMPWDQPIDNIQKALTGKFAKAACIVLICFAGIGFAASEGGGMLRKATWGVFGLAIALNAARFVAVFGS